MKVEKALHCYNYLRQFVLSVAFCILLQGYNFAQTFVVSFPIGSTVYQECELPLTVAISGIKCENTAIKCRKGLVSMVGDCKYIYRCKTVGIDTIEVFIRKGERMQRIGQQEFEVKQRPIPKANVGGLNGGVIARGSLKAQQGVGAMFFISGNHWEGCTVESFNFILLRNGKPLSSIRNEGNLFAEQIRTAFTPLLVFLTNNRTIGQFRW